MDDPIIRADRKLTKEEVEDNVIKALRMKGLAISNFKLIEAMDNNFNTENEGVSYESNVLNLKKSKEGKLSKMPVVTEEQVKELITHMKKTLKDIGNSIMSGNIKNEPLIRNGVSSPCDYCNYYKVCMFDKSLGNMERRIRELKDEEVIERIKVDEQSN